MVAPSAPRDLPLLCFVSTSPTACHDGFLFMMGFSLGAWYFLRYEYYLYTMFLRWRERFEISLAFEEIDHHAFLYHSMCT